MVKTILLTFDIEEFDLPRKYGAKINDEEMYSMSNKGTKKLLNLLDMYKIRATFFITALFAKKYPKLIKQIGKKHEVGLHGYAHSDIYQELGKKETFERLKKAKKLLERISGKKVVSFRSSRFQKIDYSILEKIGIKIDSSLLPTFIPLSFVYTLGRFENLFKSRKVFYEKGIFEVPLTVTPIIRLPLIWITFRNMPLSYGKMCTSCSLINNNFINLVFHSWDFVDITNFDIPHLSKNKTGKRLIKKIDAYINWVKKKGYKFSTITGFLSSCKIL